jgi:hypothetical protein
VSVNDRVTAQSEATHSFAALRALLPSRRSLLGTATPTRIDKIEREGTAKWALPARLERAASLS